MVVFSRQRPSWSVGLPPSNSLFPTSLLGAGVTLPRRLLPFREPSKACGRAINYLERETHAEKAKARCQSASELPAFYRL